MFGTEIQNYLPLGISPESKYARHQEFLSRAQQLEDEKTNMDLVVRRLTRNKGMAKETALQARDEFLQFFALLNLTNEPISPSQLADEFWHEALAYTQEYTEFCERNFGGYIHHSPFEHEDDNSEGEVLNAAKIAANTTGGFFWKQVYGTELQLSKKCCCKCGKRLSNRPLLSV